MEIIPYSKVLTLINGARAHLLLGNGFSIGCIPELKYKSLYEIAKQNKLSQEAEKLFMKLGTNNFEGVLKLLFDSNYVATVYGLINAKEKSKLLEDLEIIKQTLIDTIVNSHLLIPSEIETSKYESVSKFFSPYFNIFTTNYDLLLHWINMQMGVMRLGESKNPPYEDCFRANPENYDSPYLIFLEHTKSNQGIFYLHGALHLFNTMGDVCKHSWVRSGEKLIDSVKSSIVADRYPLFVAEGDAGKKYEQIQSNPYLSYCFSKFGRIQKNLVVYGHSLSDTDEHILKKICQNKDINNLFIGVYDYESSRTIDSCHLLQRKLEDKCKNKNLNIYFYDSLSANVWNLNKVEVIN